MNKYVENYNLIYYFHLLNRDLLDATFILGINIKYLYYGNLKVLQFLQIHFPKIQNLSHFI
jgi:hypothetical protein